MAMVGFNGSNRYSSAAQDARQLCARDLRPPSDVDVFYEILPQPVVDIRDGLLKGVGHFIRPEPLLVRKFFQWSFLVRLSFRGCRE